MSDIDMSDSTLEPFDYLLKLAPEFFGSRLRPARLGDIEHLQAKAMRPLPRYHRDFLHIAGGTPANSLDPFLNGRHFNIDAILGGYELLTQYDLMIPEQISIFSASEDIDQFQFLYQEHDDQSPLRLVTLDLDSGEFIPDELETLQNYLLDFAFAFRVAQLDHIRNFSPRGDRRAAPGLTLMHRMGLSPVFHLPPQQTCLEGGPWASVIFRDGSGHIASDDLQALLEICELLDEHAGMEIKPRPHRLIAPKQ